MKLHVWILALFTISLAATVGAADGWTPTREPLKDGIERTQAASTPDENLSASSFADSEAQIHNSGRRSLWRSFWRRGVFSPTGDDSHAMQPVTMAAEPVRNTSRLGGEWTAYDAQQVQPVQPVQPVQLVQYAERAPHGSGMFTSCPSWTCQLLPDGLMYHSYIAGPKEPRFGLSILDNRNEGRIWEVAMGGRMGLWRYGTTDPINPEGWQVDLEGAAFPRLNVDESQDVDATDFRFGLPLTYHRDDWRFKFGYYHLSSHVGDEYLERNPDYERINYVRESLILGSAYNVNDDVMVYGEIGYAFLVSDGAEPWEVQFGVEYTTCNARSPHGGLVVAANAHLREEVDWSGALNLIAGWQWRGHRSARTFRVGLQYYNGKSLQYQFFKEDEQLVGLGVWYDF